MANNADHVVELRGLLNKEARAEWISNLWTKYDNQRGKKREEWSEVDKYLFATSTKTTTNKTLPWTHSSTSPKLTQIRDNLHSNYLSSLFPNDKWLTWLAYSQDAAKLEKREAIEGYMENKLREGNFRETVSRLLYDYIDKGNAFAMPTFETRYKTTETERTTDFIGPTAIRISPYDIVFDPTASSFENTHKVVRSTMTLGALRKWAETHPNQTEWVDWIDNRRELHNAALTYSSEEWEKAQQYMVDGFGSLQEYYISDTVELLEFYGDYYDSVTGELSTNRMITVVDRTHVIRDIEIPTYGGKPAIYHVGWRLRPNNLWAMGPLDNLVGMQYMIDHYLNMSANALDLKIMPPKKIIGDVEAFNWSPNEEIHIDENGDVVEMAQQFGDIITAQQFIQQLEDRMELYAGAPREAMGIRTPGEKTKFEVQSLENAAGRIFNEKVIQFEIFLERLLNSMLEESHRNLDVADTIRVIDNDLGVQKFMSITKEDITADGILRPVGARHFAQRAQELQDLSGVFNVPAFAEMLGPHTSAIELSRLIEDIVDLRGYKLFSPNVAIAEAQETQALAGQAEEDNFVNAQTSEEELISEFQLAQEEANVQ